MQLLDINEAANRKNGAEESEIRGLYLLFYNKFYKVELVSKDTPLVPYSNQDLLRLQKP